MLNPQEEYKIINLIMSETKTHNKMARVQLKAVSSEEIYECIIWEDKLKTIPENILRNGNTVFVLDSFYRENFKTYTLNKLELIKEARLGLEKDQQEKLFKQLITQIDSIKDVELAEFTKNMILENESLFKIAPAAIRHHHNYLGGLLQHTYECVEMMKTLLPTIPKKLNENLLIAGCVLHDIGKIFEYKLDEVTGVIEIDKDFQSKWINHIHYGFAIANCAGFFELGHIIGSHHGIKEHGAIVEPATDEAKLVYQADMLSSRLGILNVEELETL